MDDRRFDRLTRSLAKRTSRRRGLGLLAGAGGALLAVARGRDARARHGWVQLGGACYDDDQCDQSYAGGGAEAICANNGFDYDGPFNCCLTEGDNTCFVNENCCWNLECIAGTCRDTFLGSGQPGSLELGAQCGDPVQCAGYGINATCADNNINPGGICCGFYGTSCSNNGQCCGSMFCGPDGFCTVPYEGFG